MSALTRTVGHIDSASVSQIVQTLSRSQPEDCTKWDMQTSLDVTVSLIGTTNLRISPAPGISGSASGDYALVIHGLEAIGALSRVQREEEVAKQALRATRSWATRNAETIRRTYLDAQHDMLNFRPFLDWSVHHAWVEHSQRLNGLFNQELIPNIATIMNVKKGRLMSAWEVSRTVARVRDFARAESEPLDEDFLLIRDAYTISAILRGRYHQAIASERGLDLIQHPIRELLPSLAQKRIVQVPVGPERMLATIILSSSFKEKGNKRLTLWLDNVRKAREGHLVDQMPLESTGYADRDFARAMDVVHRGEIRTHTQAVESLFDVLPPAALGLGVAAFTFFALVGWPGLVLGAATTAATGTVEYVSKKGLGSWLVPIWSGREKRLRALAELPPGHLQRPWPTSVNAPESSPSAPLGQR